MNQKIFIVDRTDQIRWYLNPNSQSFVLQMQDNHYQLRQWLEENTFDTVVICGQGKIPRMGFNEHPNNVYTFMARDQFKLYFANDDDAMLFKLTWGGQ